MINIPTQIDFENQIFNQDLQLDHTFRIEKNDNISFYQNQTF